MYQAAAGSTAKVLARGLGGPPIEKQVEELRSWLQQMAAQIPGSDGLSPARRTAQPAVPGQADRPQAGGEETSGRVDRAGAAGPGPALSAAGRVT